MKFELLSGRHSNAAGNFKPGDIVTSSNDLEKAFIHKFKRRHDLEQVSVAVTAAAPVAKKTTTTKVVNVAPPPAAPAADESAANAEDDGKGSETATDETPAAVASQFGEDVTKDFPKAAAAKLLVFKNTKGKFNVVDPSELNDTLNTTPLKDAAAVDKLIAKVTE